MSALIGYQPVAGCATLDDAAAARYHRCWAVIDGDGCILDRSQCLSLQKIKATLSFGYLVIKAEGMLRLDIPLDVIEDDDSVVFEATLGSQSVKVVDEGELAAAWVSNCLGRTCRLVKIHPDFPVPVNWW